MLKKQGRVHSGHRQASISLRLIVTQAKRPGVPTQYLRQVVGGLVSAMLADGSFGQRMEPEGRRRKTRGAGISHQALTPDQPDEQAGNGQPYRQPASRQSEQDVARRTRDLHNAFLVASCVHFSLLFGVVFLFLTDTIQNPRLPVTR